MAVFAETKRDQGADEEPYSCTVTTPDEGIAPVSTKNAALLLADAGVVHDQDLPGLFAG